MSWKFSVITSSIEMLLLKQFYLQFATKWINPLPYQELTQLYLNMIVHEKRCQILQYNISHYGLLTDWVSDSLTNWRNCSSCYPQLNWWCLSLKEREKKLHLNSKCRLSYYQPYFTQLTTTQKLNGGAGNTSSAEVLAHRFEQVSR